MKVISLQCQKGGTSKTTCATNFAVAAALDGLQVALIDLDPQVSAANWSDLRPDDRADVVTVAVPVPHLARTLKTAADNGADLAIIDTPGRTNDAALAAAKASDLVLIPIQPTMPDLQTVDATVEVLRLAGNPATKALLTRVRGTGLRIEDSTAWLKERGVEPLAVTMSERVFYQDAYAKGLGVMEMEPGGKAADEIRRVYMAACKFLGLSARRAPNGKAKRPGRRTA